MRNVLMEKISLLESENSILKQKIKEKNKLIKKITNKLKELEDMNSSTSYYQMNIYDCLRS